MGHGPSCQISQRAASARLHPRCPARRIELYPGNLALHSDRLPHVTLALAYRGAPGVRGRALRSRLAIVLRARWPVRAPRRPDRIRQAAPGPRLQAPRPDRKPSGNFVPDEVIDRFRGRGAHLEAEGAAGLGVDQFALYDMQRRQGDRRLRSRRHPSASGRMGTTVDRPLVSGLERLNAHICT